jgi:putative toxin-antitoxin system antitoxin component (TIGR02293 family)
MRVHGAPSSRPFRAGKGLKNCLPESGLGAVWTSGADDAILSINLGKWHMTAKRKTYPSGLSEVASAAFAAEPARRADVAALTSLSSHGYSEDEIFALVVPKRTFARRKAANERLTVEETDKALRLERIAVQAERVFGAADKAHRWLREPKRALQGETPLAYLASEAGARVVEEMLYRIEYGMFA